MRSRRRVVESRPHLGRSERVGGRRRAGPSGECWSSTRGACLPGQHSDRSRGPRHHQAHRPRRRDHTVTRLPDWSAHSCWGVHRRIGAGARQGPSMGWAAPATVGASWLPSPGRRGSGGVLAPPGPVVEPALLAVRSFAWSNATIVAFSVAFAGNLLLAILWMQEVWHFTPMQTGFGVRPARSWCRFCHPWGQVREERRGRPRHGAGCVLFAAGIASSRPSSAAPTTSLSCSRPDCRGMGSARLPTILSSATSGFRRFALPRAAPSST